ncbi:unnamed protein product [Nesidiocoris tenuis]|uniref:Uncharacterized protein n=2 Tax=Nesidiocoris tenuis TaxID=355587 RepID=A0A6H5HAF8_9HEMI|nr:unnamed protein product [Nesidiocoris tenuis]
MNRPFQGELLPIHVQQLVHLTEEQRAQKSDERLTQSTGRLSIGRRMTWKCTSSILPRCRRLRSPPSSYRGRKKSSEGEFLYLGAHQGPFRFAGRRYGMLQEADHGPVENAAARLQNIGRYRSRENAGLHASSGNFCLFAGDRSKLHFEVLARILSEWLNKVPECWADISPDSKLFALKVAAYVASSPSGYCKLSSSGTARTFVLLMKDSKTNSSSLTLGFLCLIEAMMSTPDGAQFVLEEGLHFTSLWRINEKYLENNLQKLNASVYFSGLWKDVTASATSSSSIYCLRQSTKLLSIMIQKASSESVGEGIFNDVTAQCPVNAALTHRGDSRALSVFKENGNNRRAGDGAIVKTMDLCRAIVTNLMDTDYPVQKIKHLLRCCHLTDWAWNVLETSNIKQVLNAANRFVCLLNALNFYQTKDENGLIPFLVSQDIIDLILKQLSVMLNRQLKEMIADACTETYKYLVKYGANVAGDKEREPHGKEVENIPYCIHNVLYLFHALPVMLVVKARIGTCWNEMLEEYIDKLFRLTNSKVMRVAYAFRDSIAQNVSQQCDLASSSLHQFISLAPNMCKEQTVLLFQTLTYLLNEFVTESSESDNVRSVTQFRVAGEEMISTFPNFLSVAVNCLYIYLNRFDFSWRDGLESLCLLSILQKLLESPSVPPKIVVDILKTINVALLKSMPASLALLVDTIEGSSMEDLGPQLFKLMHSKEWVVKDSTLETIKTIVTLSESSFPAFQILLIDNQLPQLAFSIIESDPEPFVRKSAIACLLEIAKVPHVWNTTLVDKNVVVSDSSSTIASPDDQRSSRDVELIFDTMSYVALNDFHWEVKLKCLEFYHSSMAKCIIQQGWIDGKFPDAVFSKEKKKIIKLTPDEIKNRCMAALKDLETNGCLQASEIGHLSLGVDDVIDQIVSEADVDLLGNLVDQSASCRGLPPVKRKIMRVAEFLGEIRRVNIIQMMENRSRWLADTSEGIGSLLDDILLFSGKSAPIGESSERNAVDCY